MREEKDYYEITSSDQYYHFNSKELDDIIALLEGEIRGVEIEKKIEQRNKRIDIILNEK